MACSDVSSLSRPDQGGQKAAPPINGFIGNGRHQLVGILLCLVVWIWHRQSGPSVGDLLMAAAQYSCFNATSCCAVVGFDGATRSHARTRPLYFISNISNGAGECDVPTLAVCRAA